MFKFLRLILFIKKHRKNGIANFKILTTETEIIVCPIDKNGKYLEGKIVIVY